MMSADGWLGMLEVLPDAFPPAVNTTCGIPSGGAASMSSNRTLMSAPAGARTAAPRDAGIASIRAAIYKARAAQERSLMARGVFTAAADEK